MTAAAPPPLRVVDTPEGLRDLREQWDRLGSSVSSPTRDLSWVEAAATAFPEDRLRVAVLDDGEVRAVAPLVRRGGACEAVSVRRLYEPVDFLWRDEASLGELAARLAAHRVPLVLGRIPGDSPTAETLRRAYGRRALELREPRSPLPVFELDETWREPEARLGSRRRSDLRRARRHAEEHGEVDFEVVVPGPEAVACAFDEAVGVESRGWKGRAGTALLNDPPRLAFYRRYADLAARDGSLRIAFLRIDGAVVAMQIAVERSRRLWLLKIGHDAQFDRSSPGQLLMLETIRWSASHDLEAIEFLGSSAPWTRRWTEVERPSTSVAFLPPRVGSLGPLAEHVARAGLRRVRRR
ncbi:MAG TPA: GNAT family N-acetyltransferase [Gaiellaceae bacterium]|nr:GNAT family N-acetyltransferase [Gaiellaceae bacterium]